MVDGPPRASPSNFKSPAQSAEVRCWKALCLGAGQDAESLRCCVPVVMECFISPTSIHLVGASGNNTWTISPWSVVSASIACHTFMNHDPFPHPVNCLWEVLPALLFSFLSLFFFFPPMLSIIYPIRRLTFHSASRVSIQTHMRKQKMR